MSKSVSHVCRTNKVWPAETLNKHYVNQMCKHCLKSGYLLYAPNGWNFSLLNEKVS